MEEHVLFERKQFDFVFDLMCLPLFCLNVVSV